MEDGSSAAVSTVGLAQASDVVWVFVCFVLVLLMQAGFACYEVRLPHSHHARNTVFLVSEAAGMSMLAALVCGLFRSNVGNVAVSLPRAVKNGWSVSGRHDTCRLFNPTDLAQEHR